MVGRRCRCRKMSSKRNESSGKLRVRLVRRSEVLPVAPASFRQAQGRLAGCPESVPLSARRAGRTAGQPPRRRRYRCSLLTLHPRRLKLVALLPPDELREAGRFPAQRESKPRHRRIADEIHLRMVFIARLVVVLLGVFLVLRQSPGLVVTFELHPFVDRERRNAYARQAEMIGAVEVSSLGTRIWTNRQPEFFRSRLHPRIECRSFRP